MRSDTIFGMLGQLLGEARTSADLQLRLLDLEAQRAGQTLALLQAYGMVAALLLCSAWLGLCAVGMLWLMERGCSPSLALLPVVLLNLAGAAGLVFAMRQKARALAFPATRHNLGGGILLFLACSKLLRPRQP